MNQINNNYNNNFLFPLGFCYASFIVSLVKLFVRHTFVVFCCCLFQLYVNELTAYKQQACWWAHHHSSYLCFFLNKFLFKPTMKQKSVTVLCHVSADWSMARVRHWPWTPPTRYDTNHTFTTPSLARTGHLNTYCNPWQQWRVIYH